MKDRTETEIKAAIRIRLSKLGVVIWQQATGHGRTDSGSEISFGLCRGSSDLIGIRRSDGKFIAIEVKTVTGKRKHELALARAYKKIDSSPKVPMTGEERRALEQQLFVDLISRFSGLAGFATSEDEAEEIVK